MTDLWELMVEETRQSFNQIENLTSALDVKSSIIIATDAVLLSALLLVPNFNYLKLTIQLLIVVPLFLSIVFAVGCLYPRKWDHIYGNTLLNKYENSDNTDYVFCVVAKTHADNEVGLRKAHDSKLLFFKVGTLFMIFTLLAEFTLFIYLLFDP